MKRVCSLGMLGLALAGVGELVARATYRAVERGLRRAFAEVEG